MSGERVLVTGAASGIGAATAAQLRRRGARVAGLDLHADAGEELIRWRVTAAAVEPLRSSRGRVVNIASGLAHLTIPFATAYCMSKRGVVAYSDALRIEHGDAITVTTVYPGYIRTPIHAAAAEQGITLEGMVPAEDLDEAAAVVVRAAVGDPARDLATTRRGTFGYALLRLAPRRLVDRVTTAQLRRAARRRAFDASPLAADLRERLLSAR